MKKVMILSVLITICFSVISGYCLEETEVIKLLSPSHNGKVSVEKAIYDRRSTRNFQEKALNPAQVSQLLWAAGGVTIDGVTGPTRAFPSAGGIYPHEIYIVIGNAIKFDPGIYLYDWKTHSLKLLRKGDIRSQLSEACYGQKMIQFAPATIVITAFPGKVAEKYGEWGATEFVPLDAGHIGQNVHLQALSIGLGTVMMAGFQGSEVSKVMDLNKDGGERAVYIMPLGYPNE